MASARTSESHVTEPEPVTASSKRFGRYRLSYELAAGGMGTVYLARAEGPAGFEKLVALKRIHQHLAKDERFVAMFLDEARIAAQIHHPNVCSVIDFGCVDGAYYLTMPFVAGESLHRVIRAVHGRDDAALRERALYAAIRIVADACEGLHAAHELRDARGELLDVVHRDVSPQNLLVGYDGGARVLDFGVASARDRLYSTATGEVKGKFAYLSPEQIDGRDVDRRADVWALGVVLYECVGLRRLFARKTMAETVQAVLEGAIAPLSEVAPHVPLALEEIVFKALARDRDRRYATARDMGRDLLAFLAEEARVVGPAEVAELMQALFPTGEAEKRSMLDRAREEEASEISIAVAEPVSEGATRRRSPALSIALVALAAVGFGVGGTLLWMGPPEEAEPPVSAPPAAALVTQTGAAPQPPIQTAVAETPPRAETASAPVEPDAAAAPAREEEASERREPRGRGTLSVVTTGGWALVYRGRTRLGEAPGTFSLPAGTHVIGIQPLGRGEIRRFRVHVTAGETTRFAAR